MPSLEYFFVTLLCIQSVCASSFNEDVSSVGKTSMQLSAIRAVASNANTTHYSDPMASILAGPKMLTAVQARADSEMRQRKWHVSPHVGRHMILDAMIHNVVVASCHAPRQVVIIGAGMDTRAYRLGESLPALRWWEVDQAEIVKIKEEMLMESGMDVTRAGRIVRVALNLESDIGNLLPRLQDAGFDPNSPAIFLLEGLVYYLPAKVVSDLLSSIPTLPTNRIFVSIMKRKTRTYFRRKAEQAGREELWKCDLEQLCSDQVFPQKSWRLIRRVQTNTRGARKLK